MTLYRRIAEKTPIAVPIMAITLLSLFSPSDASAQSLVVGNCSTTTASFLDTETVCVSGTTAGSIDSDPAFLCVLPSTGGTRLDDVTPGGCSEFPPQSTLVNEPVWLPPTIPGSYIVVLFASDESVHSQPIAIIDSSNTAPTATPQSVSTDEDTPLAITLGGTDPESDPLTFTVATGPSNGSLSGTAPNLTYTPNAGYNGADSFTFTANDGLLDSAAATISITVNALNDAPTATPQSVSTDEDTPLAITLGGTDPESDPLTFTVATGPSNGSLNGTAPNLTYTPNANFNGADSFTFTANDGLLDSAAATISIRISQQNDQPVITAQVPLSTPEDTGLTIVLGDLTIADPDSTVFTLAVQDGVNYSRLGNTLTPAADFNGDLTVPVTVMDDSGMGNAVSAVFNLTVSVASVNDQPVITGQGSVVTLEATSRTILLTDLIVTDPDNAFPADFTLAVQDGADYMRAGDTITPATGFNGDLIVPVTVNDGTSNSPVFNLIVTVTAVNNQPQITGQVSLSTPEETALALAATDLTIVDADSVFPTDFTLSVQDGAHYTRVGNTITPAVDYSGILTVPVTVSDGTDISPVFNLSVTVTAINDQPVITGQNTVTTPEATARVIMLADLIVTDPDSTVFALAVQDGANYTRVGNEITPVDDFNGDLTVPVAVTDDSAESNATSAVFNLVVSVSAVNNQPMITAQVQLFTLEDTALTITLSDISITDADSVYPDDFTLSVQDGAYYTRVGNTITPAADFEGVLTVPVTVSDGTDVSPVFNLTIPVTAVNDQPVITDHIALSTPEDTSLTILVTDLIVLDPDSVFPGDFTLQLYDGTNYARTGNTITPVANFNGTLSVPATVSDGLLTSAQSILAIDVSAVNDDPFVVEPIPTQLVVEGTAFSLNVFANFSDADNDTLEFAASGLPASGNLIIDPHTGVISGTPRVEDARDNAPYTVVVSATDNQSGTIPAQTEFELNISALDRANVSLDISVTPEPAMLNDELNWTFTTRNAVGPQPVANVALTGSFVGSGLSISSTSSCTIQATVGQVTDFECTLGNLAVGGSATVDITTTTGTHGDVVVFGTAATTDASPLDPIFDDNSSQMAVGVAAAFSLGAVQELGNSNVRSVAAGDVNGDGMADLVVGTVAGQPVEIYLSGGFRDFVTSPITLTDNFANEGVAIADFDGNGTLDLVVANGGGQADIIYSNDGVGNFAPIAMLGASSSQDVAVGDFDNDGIMDVVFATTQGNPVYLGDGLGGFGLCATLGNANSRAVAVGRFDGDTRDDVVFANTGSDSQLWTMNRSAGFSAGTRFMIGDAVSVTVGEFGGDARPDLAFGRIPTGPGDVPSNPVFVNDGLGGFGNPMAVVGVSPTNDIHAGDVNRDGLTDLVFINSSGVHQIWTATGNGFDLHREQIADADSTVGVVTELGMTDVGDPGGVDLAMGGAIASGLGIFLNDGFGNLGFGDAVPPVLTLVGQATISISSGRAYIESGATALDNIDGDISLSVVATGAVDTSVAGNYVVTYNVVDRAGNEAAPITRTITVTAAVGTGGGGGGSLSLFLLFLLAIAAFLNEYHANRATVPNESPGQGRTRNA